MTSGTKYRQGDVVLVPYPFTDLSAVKKRPVLVLSKDTSGEDLITCGITSNLADRKNSVVIQQEDFAEGELPKKSTVKVDKLFTLEKNIIKRAFGRLTPEAMSEVREIFTSLV